MVSALVPYKRVDLAMMAARQAGVGLTVVGNGPERANLERLTGDGIELAGWRTDEEIRDLYRTRASPPFFPAKKISASCPSKRKPAAVPSSRLDAAARSTP